MCPGKVRQAGSALLSDPSRAPQLKRRLVQFCWINRWDRGSWMIGETSLEIGDLYKRWQVELESRYARRNKVHYIDELLNELELLNLAESRTMSDRVRAQVKELLQSSDHHLSPNRTNTLTL